MSKYFWAVRQDDDVWICKEDPGDAVLSNPNWSSDFCGDTNCCDPNEQDVFLSSDFLNKHANPEIDSLCYLGWRKVTGITLAKGERLHTFIADEGE